MKYLKTYDCYTNNFQYSLFESIDVELRLNYQYLVELPKLPKNLKFLYCNNNELTSLPKLPKTLEFLECTDNKLSFLPEIPKSLNHLDFRYNNLTIFPDSNSLVLLITSDVSISIYSISL